MTILVIAEHDNAALKSATLNTLSAAAALGDVHVLVAGSGCGAVAEAVAQVSGVAKVLLADAAPYAHGLAENLAPLVVGLAGGYSHVLAPATAFGKNLAPRVAALLDVAQISDIIRVVDADTFVRPIYAGNVLATVQSADAVKVITVRGTGFPAAATSGGSAAIERLDSATDAGVSEFKSAELTKSERPELTSARIIVSGGRGMGSGENFGILETLADQLGAAVGASRAAVDAGRTDRQDRRPRALHRRRHQRRDPAPGGHEGLEGDRGGQQRRRGADLPGGRLRHRRRPVPGRAGTVEGPGLIREARLPC